MRHHAALHTCAHAHMHTCTHAHMRHHAALHTCTRAHVHTCTHAHMHTCTRAHVHTCTHAHMRQHAARHLSALHSVALLSAALHTCAHAHMHTCSKCTCTCTCTCMHAGPGDLADARLLQLTTVPLSTLLLYYVTKLRRTGGSRWCSTSRASRYASCTRSAGKTCGAGWPCCRSATSS